MKNFFVLVLFSCGLLAIQTSAQTRPANTPATSSQQTSVPQRDAVGFNLSDYGVSFQTDPRLIVMMAALEAAGFDAVPAGEEPSAFRALGRKDKATLDPDVRTKLRRFYEGNKLPAPASAADQAARYVSLALALGPPPLLEAPARSEDLPSSLLEVLDFAPLVKEFYDRSHFDQKMPAYIRAYQAEGD